VRRRTVLIALAAAALILVIWLRPGFSSGSPPESLPLNEFQEKLADGEVETTSLLDRSNVVTGELRDGSEYRTRFPDAYTETLTEEILDAGLDLRVKSEATSIWTELFLSIVPTVVAIGLLMWLLMRMYGRTVLGLGKSKAKTVNKDQPDVGFADVAGLDEAVEELGEIKDFLANPKRFEAMGARIPKGVLLYGPPGTGKTLLARAVAGEAGVPFFSISGSDFVEMYVGVGAARVRDLFKIAKSSAPAIIFVDEIDAVGRHRGAGVGGGHDEREQTLNQLLVEMDGFDVRSGVILIAATNRPDILDPALLRPGRFDRQIVVDRPDLEGRRGILRVHARDKPFAEGVDLDVIARRTPGFTGADLANLVNEATLLAARRGFDKVGMPQLEEAIERVIAGPQRRTKVINPHEQRVIAFHEAGHAIVGYALPGRDPVHKISIIPRGRALGFTLVLPTEDRLLMTRHQLAAEMAMLMGGRTAEELTFNDPTTGAYDDIERATNIARRMVTEFGMSEELGLIRLGSNAEEVFLGREIGHAPEYSEEVAARVDAEVRRLLDTARTTAREVLETNRAALERLAEALLERETLDAAEIEALLSDVVTWPGGAAGSELPSAIASKKPNQSGKPGS
jgi:cell division protease FtsH